MRKYGRFVMDSEVKEFENFSFTKLESLPI
jgi:hypothetical protein